MRSIVYTNKTHDLKVICVAPFSKDVPFRQTLKAGMVLTVRVKCFVKEQNRDQDRLEPRPLESQSDAL